VKAKVLAFGELELEGERYDYDVVVKAGTVKKRKKDRSRPFRDRYGHTPLSIKEDIPWGGKQLVVGTGVYGRLPVMPEVEAEAKRQGIELVVLPTKEACRYLSSVKREKTYAVLHATC
jgi:hypothetical protein